MKRILTAVITAIEAGAVALAGLVCVAVPGILLWIVTFQLAIEPTEVAAAVSGVWLLGHGVPLSFVIDAPTALLLGLTPETLTFTLSLAPLGLALISAGFGARIGWRLGRRGGAGAVGLPAGAVGFAALVILPASLAGPLLTEPLWAAVVTPTLFFATPLVAGFVVRAARDDHEWWHQFLREINRGTAQLGWRRPELGRSVVTDALRLAAATLAALLGVAALSVAVALIGGYAQVVTLSQHLQLDPIGAIIIFLAQLALLPVAVIWALSWLIGAGFSLGEGTSVTPFETLLGPVPALPMFGAIPPAWGSWGGIAPLVVVLGALACGVVFGRRRGARGTVREAIILVLAATFVGLTVAGLAALSTGSIGPERLEVTGPNIWIAGALAAAEVLVGLSLGTLGVRADVSRNLEQAKALVEVSGLRVRAVATGFGRGADRTTGDDRPTEEYELLDRGAVTGLGASAISSRTADYGETEFTSVRATPSGGLPGVTERPDSWPAEADTCSDYGSPEESDPAEVVSREAGPTLAEPTEASPTEADLAEAEDALVRAYAWDESTRIDSDLESGAPAQRKRSWWRRPSS